VEKVYHLDCNNIVLHLYVAAFFCSDMKPQKSMLDYCKKVLQCVRFDIRLFRKEYRKSIRWLEPMEVKQLKQWIRQGKTSHI
jgi:hypothetical protein